MATNVAEEPCLISGLVAMAIDALAIDTLDATVQSRWQIAPHEPGRGSADGDEWQIAMPSNRRSGTSSKRPNTKPTIHPTSDGGRDFVTVLRLSGGAATTIGISRVAFGSLAHESLARRSMK